VQTVVEKAGQNFKGFYSHYGHSYAGSSESDAASGLLAELKGLEEATAAVPESFAGKLVLTVGATPTATAAQNLLAQEGKEADEFKSLLEKLKAKFAVELHAGVYPLLDLQQVATHARPTTGQTPLSKEAIGCKLLVEVVSLYDERTKPEALISAGSLALGREPCKSYPGWGIVSPELGNSHNAVYDERGEKTGWIVGKVSQEHGILSWEGAKERMGPLVIGEKLLGWPNLACVAGAGFGWYCVVDSEEGGEEVVDVWVRWRGW
jgi:D-serine deaminase-like pyridoxal phosphate-dependent protein